MNTQEIYAAIDLIRAKKFNEVDPLVLDRLCNYAETNADDIAEAYKESEENN